MLEMLRKGWLPTWIAAVYFIYPIPHTIALRNLLLISGLMVCLVVIFNDKNQAHLRPQLKAFQASGWLLLTLTLWIIFQSAFISPYPHLALEMVRGDWLTALLVATTGGIVVMANQQWEPNRPLGAIIFSLTLHIACLLAYQVWLWAQTGHYPFGATPFAQKDYHSMLVTTLIALLLADVSMRAFNPRHMTTLPLPAMLVALLLSFIATITLLARNAVIINFIMLLMTICLISFSRRERADRWLAPTAIVLLVISVVVGGIGLRSDSRWQGFAEATAAALDTEHNLAWLNPQEYPLPLMKNGQPVEESAYSRLAWGKVGLEQVGRYPLGLGYGHKAFGWAIHLSYDVQTGHESSHSGLLDFTLANGLPGLILWLALAFALMRAGWRAFRKQRSVAGLALVFSVTAYLVRCLVDGHLSGFRLEMYAFLMGLLIMLQSIETKRCN